MTNQEAYERIRAYFTRPRAKIAFSEDEGRCMYRLGRRASAKTRCPVGVLIPDEVYRREFEEKDVAEIIDAVPALAGSDARFLNRAQDYHDDSQSPAEFVAMLDLLASDNGLVTVAS